MSDASRMAVHTPMIDHTSQDQECPACGLIGPPDIEFRRISEKVDARPCSHFERDGTQPEPHLHCSCTRCGYVWSMRIKHPDGVVRLHS